MLRQWFRISGSMVLLLSVTASHALAADDSLPYSEWVCPGMIAIAVIGVVIMVLRGPDGSWFFLYGDKGRPLWLRLLRCGGILLLLVPLDLFQSGVDEVVGAGRIFTDYLIDTIALCIITRALFALHPGHGRGG